MGYIVFSPLRPLLTQPRKQSVMAITRGKGTGDVLPSVAGHRAVKPSCGQTGPSRPPLSGPFAVSWQGRGE